MVSWHTLVVAFVVEDVRILAGDKGHARETEATVQRVAQSFWIMDRFKLSHYHTLRRLTQHKQQGPAMPQSQQQQALLKRVKRHTVVRSSLMCGDAHAHTPQLHCAFERGGKEVLGTHRERRKQHNAPALRGPCALASWACARPGVRLAGRRYLLDLDVSVRHEGGGAHYVAPGLQAGHHLAAAMRGGGGREKWTEGGEMLERGVKPGCRGGEQQRMSKATTCHATTE